MGFSCRLFGGDELHAQFVGAQSELAQDPVAVSLFVIGLALVGVLLALGQHRVDQPSQLVGGGGDGLGFVHPRTHAPEVRAVCVHGEQSRRRTQLQAGGDGCAARGRGRSSAGRHCGQRPRNQARRHGARDGREHGLVHELPQVHALAQAGFMNAEATSHEVIAAQ